MAHTFDSGATLPQRRLIRSQIVGRLASLLRSNGLYLNTIGHLPVVFDAGDEDSRTAFVNASPTSPSVHVALGDLEFEPAGMGEASSWSGELDVQVLIAQRVDRAEQATLAGEVVGDADVTAPPGIETILEHVFERLAGQRLRTAVGSAAAATHTAELRPEAERLAWFGDGWIAWEQRYRLEVYANVDHHRGAPLVVDILADHNVDGATVDIDHDANPVAQTLSDLEEP